VERGKRSRQYSISFIGVVALVTIGLALVAWSAQDQTLALASAVLGLYALHLISIRYILEGQSRNQEQLETQWNLLQLMVDPNSGPRNGPTAGGNGKLAGAPGTQKQRIPTPRHFALGTVALIRELLTAEQVARILVQQRDLPDERFAAIAVDLGMLNEEQREELLLAQQEGLFTDEEMRDARERLGEFRKATAKALSAIG
jgi:hypothetical protein